MTIGIVRSSVAVFITHKLIQQVNNDGPKKAEFEFTLKRKGIDFIVPVVMEECCRDTRNWRGPVGLQLGGKL